MSRRFANLIQLAIERFEIEDDFLLLSEALSIGQIEDQLKQKGVDVTKYDSKHYLFLLALLNSDLNLDVYTHITSNIKDQGLLNRILGSTVDRRSNTPTVDVDAINRIAHNTNNIGEIVRILNSVNQNRQAAAPVASEEDKAKSIEDSATRFKKEIERGLKEKFTVEEEYNYIIKIIYGLIENQKKLRPNDRLVQNYSYAIPMASYFLNFPENQELTRLGRLLYDLFPRYMADDDIREKKIIFQAPYNTNFYEFSNYLYKYLRDKKFKDDKGSDLMKDWVFRNEDVTVYAGTVSNPQQSVRRCVKYGKGVNPKYGLCISGSSAASHYANYRYETSPRNSLTTYFVYFNKTEDIRKYNSDFFLFEPFYDAHKDKEITYQFNPGVGNPGERRISPEAAFEKYPMLKAPFDEGVFKVLPVTEEEKAQYDKIKRAEIESLSSAEDLIDWIEMKDPLLDSSKLSLIRRKFPEGFTYALDFYFKRRVDFAEDNITNTYINNGGTLESHVFKDTARFFSDNPELLKRYDKFRESLKSKEISLMMNSGGQVNADYFEMVLKDYPNLIDRSIDQYITAREQSWEPRTNSDLYTHIYKQLNTFFDKHPEFKEKYKTQISDFILKEMELKVNAGEYLTSDFLEKFNESYPDRIDGYLDRYINKRTEMYFSEQPSTDLDNFIFDRILHFIVDHDKFDIYKPSRELRIKEIEYILGEGLIFGTGFLTRLKSDYPDLVIETLDRYLTKRKQSYLDNSTRYTSINELVYKDLYYGMDTFMKNEREIRKRYIKYEEEMILNSIGLIRSDVVYERDLNVIKEEYPDILEKYLEIYLNKKTLYISSVKYDNEHDVYYVAGTDSGWSHEDIMETFIDPFALRQIKPFLNKNPELAEKLKPLTEKLQLAYDFNKIVLSGNVIDSDEAESLKKEYGYEKFIKLFDTYLDNRIVKCQGDFADVIRAGNERRNPVPKGDIEEYIFNPLRKFFHYNPQIAKDYRNLQRDLKLKAFDYCGEPENIFNSNYHHFDENDWYLTSGWLQDVKNRFPEILQKGLDLYITQKLNAENVNRYMDNDYYDRKSIHVNVESEVFKRIKEFEEQNKSLFEKYKAQRMAYIKRHVDIMGFKDLLDSSYFFRLEETFRPTFYRVIFKRYIDRKLKFIEDRKFKNDEMGHKEHFDDDYRDVKDKDLYGYIFDPLEEFIQAHPDLIQNYGEKTNDIKYQFLINYLTDPEVSTNIERKALKYISHLNNNEEDNTPIYSRILEELLNSFDKASFRASSAIEAVEEFYTKIKDKNTLKQIFRSERNIKFLYNVFTSDMHNVVLRSDDYSYGVSGIHKLIQNKIKISKLKESNPNSFYKMVNEIEPDLVDKVLEENLYSIINTNTNITFYRILQIFFKSPYNLYAYIESNKKLNDLFYRVLRSSNISQVNLYGIFENSTEYMIQRFFEYIQKHPDHEESNIFKSAIEHDQKQIEKFKKEIETHNNIIDHKYLAIAFFKNPPDLSNCILNSTYSSFSSIKIKSIYPIESLKFLPKASAKYCMIDIRDCTLKNNIDFLPENTENISLDGVTVSSDKDLIAKGITDKIIGVTLNDVKGLKTLKGLNNINKRKINLKITRCKDLVSLEGSPQKVNSMEIGICDNLKNFKGGPLESINSVTVSSMNGLVNFVGIPRSGQYSLSYNRINSFKGLPNHINSLKIIDSISNKNLIRKSYSYFPNRINWLSASSMQDEGKKTYSRYLFSRILNVFPSYIGNIQDHIPYLSHPHNDETIINNFRGDKTGNSYLDRLIDIYTKNFNKYKNKEQEDKESFERIIQKRTPSKQDELESIEKKQDKATEREKKKRLKKESVDVIPFHNLMDNIISNIVTSFKVYK